MTLHRRPPRPLHRGARALATLTTAALAAVALATAPAGASSSPEPGETTTTTEPEQTEPDTTTTTTVLPSPESTTPGTPPDEEPPAVGDPGDPDDPADPGEPEATTTTSTLPPLPAAKHVYVGPEKLDHILATIRYLESRGNYLAPPNKGNASGAYQFIASTWAGHGGYPHAYLAPPEIQDERAAIDVMKFLERWNYDVSMIPVLWYYPRGASNPALMDVVPVPSAGNVLTIREYQTRWLGIYSFLAGQPVPPTLSAEERVSRAGLPPRLPADNDGTLAIAYPVLGPSRVAAPACDARDAPDDGPTAGEFAAAGLCAEEAPAIVFGVKLQPVLAVADGVVTAVRDHPGSGEPISVTITDVTGRSFIHSGFNDDSPGTDDGNAPAHLRLSAIAVVGHTVRAGQVLGFMGNSNPLPLGVRAEVPTDATVSIDPDAVAPHIKISVVDLGGVPVDAFGPLIDALFRQSCSVATGPWSMTANGDGHRPTTIETTDNDREIDSEWVIDATGRVTASGWAAMINPHHDCPYAPADPHGPGAAGSTEIPLDWFTPVDLPTSIWVDLAAELTFLSSTPPLLRR